ncbi:MAG: preprotein translocase subunit SecE [Chloroflexi bacterium]|nr:preprotein translocase subunit SecE [Chloroflexota bacterium]
MGTQAARRAFNVRIFGEVVGELRRVTWPTRQETMRLTLMVISVSVVIGIFLGIVDLGFSRLLNVMLGN